MRCFCFAAQPFQTLTQKPLARSSRGDFEAQLQQSLMRTRSFSGNGFVSPIPPRKSKSLLTFPLTQVAPLGLWVIPPTKEHAASHQSRRLSIGLHHPHPAPSSPSGSIISIRPRHLWSITSIRFHHLHPSSPSSSIIPIGLHHSHQAPSPPSSSIIPNGLHQAPSGLTVTVTQGGERNLATREQCHPKWTEDTVSSGGAGEFLAAVEWC